MLSICYEETCCCPRVETSCDLFPDSTLADLYDPLTMPAELTKAHAALDRAVDKCYRSRPFIDELNRMQFLFALYEELVLSPDKVRG